MDEKGFQSDPKVGGVHFKDTQDIQVLQNKCQVLAHALEIDRNILQNLLIRLPEAVHISGIRANVDLTPIFSLLSRTDLERAQVDNILKRLDGKIVLVRLTPQIARSGFCKSLIQF